MTTDHADEATPRTAPRSLLHRAVITGLASVLVALTSVASASAQTVAGAEPPAPAPAPPPPKKEAARPKAAPKTAAAAPAPAPPPAPTPSTTSPDPAASAPLSSAATPATGSSSTTTVNVVSAASLTCVPECRSGFVCREGECVSACNPQCGENETCNAKRECVPRSEANDPYPYDKTRFGVGGAFGVNSSADGTGTPFGGLVSVALPLGGHWYSREDVIVTYAKTSTDDHYYVGGTVSPNGTTPVDQSYLLIALRATGGYQFSNLISARLGVIAGSHSLHTAHGFCGVGYTEKDDTSVAIGGTGALAFALKHADLSAVIDAYSANTQALCSVPVNAFGGFSGQPATLVPQRQFAAQFLAQATFLF